MYLILAVLLSVARVEAAELVALKQNYLGLKGGWGLPVSHPSRFAFGIDGGLQLSETLNGGFYYITSNRNSDDSQSRLNHYGLSLESRLEPYFGSCLRHFHFGVRAGAGDVYRTASAEDPGHAYTDLSAGLQARAGWSVFYDFSVGAEVAYLYNFGERSLSTFYALVNVRYQL